MIINHNISALNTHRQLGANNNAVSQSLEKLSSGLKINSAGDDAAGLAISEKMRGQIRGLEMATKNAQDGISLIQTAEGALTETHAILQRMNELAVQAANDTNMDDVDREAMQGELKELLAEIDEIANSRTEFNTQKLLNGSFEDKIFHIGANQGQSITVSIDAMHADAIGLNGVELEQATDGELEIDGQTLDNLKVLKDGDDIVAVEVDVDGETGWYVVSDLIAESDGQQDPTFSVVVKDGAKALTNIVEDNGEYSIAAVSIDDQKSADAAITTIQNATNTVSSQRAYLGAIQNRLEHTIINLGASQENLTAAESRIRDVDMAKEMMEFTKNNILTQAAQAMLAQFEQVAA